MTSYDSYDYAATGEEISCAGQWKTHQTESVLFDWMKPVDGNTVSYFAPSLSLCLYTQAFSVITLKGTWGFVYIIPA